jgi:hypothetical protein
MKLTPSSNYCTFSCFFFFFHQRTNERARERENEREIIRLLPPYEKFFFLPDYFRLICHLNPPPNSELTHFGVAINGNYIKIDTHQV